METKLIKIQDSEWIKDEELAEAARIIREGGLVAFPTETVYGLGANALNEDAARKIYTAKGRPSDNPLIAHISCMEELDPLVKEIPEAGRKLAEAYWPGPLTMVFPKSEIVPYGTTGGLDTVAVRMPSDPIAGRLIALSGVPIAAPSANTSGRPSPTTAQHVWQDMNGKIEMILDGGPVGIGVESTIVDVSGPVPVLLRPGAVTMEMLEAVAGQVEIDPAIQGPPREDLRPKAPGMKYRHYAPSADYTIYKGDEVKVAEKIIELANEKADEGKITGIITADQHLHMYQGRLNKSIKVVSLGDLEKPETVANHLFKALRDFDKVDTEFIFGEAFSEKNVGQAIMNRLTKAAGYNIIDV